ncbi:MAG: PBP1A family penicillin-binding protein [Oligoflexia bacterium]|nr:PBP1A family penicillin-binding protein [Oligoflexia bacterium]
MTEVQTEKRGAAWILRMTFILMVAGTFLGVVVAGAIFWHFSRDLPNIITVADYKPLTVTRIVATGGSQESETPGPEKEVVIGEFFKQRRYLVPYEKIPPIVIQAFISAEDDQFFQHSGINVVSMIRAGIANFRAGHTVQGGSTITQQVTKSLLLTSEKTFVRKIKEVILASRLERHLTKEQILYLYLNQIYLGHGQGMGVYGVEAASRVYFRKEVGQLNAGEAALLAGLPQAPSKYSPLLNPARAKERQRYVLRRMAENGVITPAQLAEAAAAPLKIHHDEEINKTFAPYLVEHLRRYLLDKYGEEAVYEQGLTVQVPTTRELALAARRSLQDGLDQVDKRIGYRGPIKQLKTSEEMEKFLKDLRFQLIDRKLQHAVLFADGRLDPLGAMQLAGLRGEWQLLDIGKKYEALVTSVDDKRKVAGVVIGAIRAEIPMDQMSWAAPPRDEQNPGYRPRPTVPSKVVSKGDVVLVRILEANDKQVLAALDQQPQVQGALLSLDVRSGKVLAMEGGYDFATSEFNRAFQAQRQPGSSFKPIIFSAALEKGYNPATVIVDSPIVYEDADSGKWKPSNFEEKFYGDTTFRQALIKSRNVPTIKIVQSIQVPYVIDYAKRLGITGQFNRDLSISLGSGAVTLYDLTKVYALFPRLGRKVNPVFHTKILDRNGKVLEESEAQPAPASLGSAPAATPSAAPAMAEATPSPSPGPFGPAPLVPIPQYPLEGDPDQVLDPRVAYMMSHLMTEVVAYGTGHAAKGLGRPAAGKTGTTNEYIDAWFMGFTPDVVTGVWVGFDNHRTMGTGETGAKSALPIWLTYMQEAVKSYPVEDFAVPPGVVFASINPNSGKLAAANSSSAIKEAFIEGTQPTETTDKTAVSPESQSEFFKEDIE